MKKSNRRILRVFSKVDGSIVSQGNHTFQQKFDIGGIQSNKNEIESLFHPCLFCVEIILLFIFFQCLKVSGPQDAKVSRSRISHKFKENMWRYIVVYPLCAAGGLTDLIRQSKDEQPDADEEIHPVFTLRAIIIIHLNEYCKRIIWDQCSAMIKIEH